MKNIVEKKSFDRYLALRDKLNRNSKPVTLMDMATIGARYLKKEGISKDIDTSDEINACSIIRKILLNHLVRGFFELGNNRKKIITKRGKQKSTNR